jgi:hypothetical protein
MPEFETIDSQIQRLASVLAAQKQEFRETISAVRNRFGFVEDALTSSGVRALLVVGSDLEVGLVWVDHTDDNNSFRLEVILIFEDGKVGPSDPWQNTDLETLLETSKYLPALLEKGVEWSAARLEKVREAAFGNNVEQAEGA